MSANSTNDHNPQECDILFQISDLPKQLCNIILWNAKQALDSKTIEELLNITSIGTDRMHRFVQEHILPPLTTGPHKRTRKLATFTHKATTARESKKREQELTNIAKNAMKILQASGICTQTSIGDS